MQQSRLKIKKFRYESCGYVLLAINVSCIKGSAEMEETMGIYEACPVLENEQLMVRLIQQQDADDLASVYSDKFALPFFNSDCCHGSNFYCATKEDVANAIKYWLIEYHENKGFVRFSIIDKKQNKVVGTIEMFQRKSTDAYDGYGILRIDVRSDYEKTSWIYAILDLIVEPFYEWFACCHIATKAAVYAIDRIEALKKMGFVQSTKPLLDQHHAIAYYDYWIRQRQ